MSEPLLEIQAAADDLRAAFPRVAYVQRNAVKLATVALRRLHAARAYATDGVDEATKTPLLRRAGLG